MNVKEIMSPKVEWVSQDITVEKAAEKMREYDIGCLPVKRAEDGGLIGLVTDRDITCRCVAEGLDPAMATVDEIMSKDLTTCFDDQDSTAAAHLMVEKGIQRLPVLDRASDMVGLLSIADLAVHGPNELSAEVLEAVSKTTH